MRSELRLVVFDVDGTLVDSQAHIVSSMNAAFEGLGLPVPPRSDVLALVGLSLDIYMPKLVPHLSEAQHVRLIQAYKEAYMAQRIERGSAASSPLYEGALTCLQRLDAMPDVVLGVATGKSKRGLDKLIEGHQLEGMFVTQQVADFHPSKPHPSMLLNAMAEAGVAVQDAVMVGDTSFDMEMAKNAGMSSIGVKWGYHSADQLQDATCLIEGFDHLEQALKQIWDEER